jgi:hypothetical protein
MNKEYYKNTEEIWKDIPEYRGFYQASNLGNTKNTKTGKILMSYIINKYGHSRVKLYKNNIKKSYYVHRLILETFIGPCPPGMECRHLDGNPENNKLENLKWGTRLENINDRKLHGTDSKTILSNAILIKHQIPEIRKLLNSGKFTQGEIGKIFGVSNSVISDINVGRTWGE